MFEKIRIITNLKKDPGERFTAMLKHWLEKRGKTVTVAYQITSLAKEEVDMVLTLGGDGTIIGVAKAVSEVGIPVLGINLGHLGFLATTEEKGAFAILEEIFQGNYQIEKRMMLSVLEAGESKECCGRVLNEIVLKRHDLSKMLSYHLYVNGHVAGYYRADGVILSTPTGSTAYNLSAGGPIIFPNCENIVVTPICPHSLFARPLVLSAEDVVEIAIEDQGEDVFITLDGNEKKSLDATSKIRIARSKQTTDLIRKKNESFFSVLDEKLGSVRLI